MVVLTAPTLSGMACGSSCRKNPGTNWSKGRICHIYWVTMLYQSQQRPARTVYDLDIETVAVCGGKKARRWVLPQRLLNFRVVYLISDVTPNVVERVFKLAFSLSLTTTSRAFVTSCWLAWFLIFSCKWLTGLKSLHSYFILKYQLYLVYICLLIWV